MNYATIVPFASSSSASARPGGREEDGSAGEGVDAPRLTQSPFAAGSLVARVLSPGCYSVSLFGSGAEYAGY